VKKKKSYKTPPRARTTKDVPTDEGEENPQKKRKKHSSKKRTKHTKQSDNSSTDSTGVSEALIFRI